MIEERQELRAKNEGHMLCYRLDILKRKYKEAVEAEEKSKERNKKMFSDIQQFRESIIEDRKKIARFKVSLDVAKV